MGTSQCRIGPFFTLGVVAMVGAAMLVDNIRAREPFIVHEWAFGDTWEVKTVARGWPFAYYERTEVSLFLAQFNCTAPSSFPPTTKQPQPYWNDPRALALAANITLGLFMLLATAIVTEYWRRHGTGPFQYSLRSMLVATAVVAVVVSMLENRVMHWSVLLTPMIAVGIVSLPAVVGLVLDCFVRRSDRRLSELRSRFESRCETI